MKSKTLLGLGALLAGVGVVGCPVFPDECKYGNACEAVATDGSLPDGSVLDTSIPDGNMPDSEPPPGCTTPDEPLKNPEKCLVDAFGAFVSPTGEDSNPGTKARPFKTIGKAIGTTQARIVVCEGTYNESLEIGRNVTVLSGIDCSFSRASAKAKVVAGKPEFAVSIAKPASAVQLRDVEVEAIDGTSTSVNSIALLVSEVASVKLVGVSATAKKGFDAPAGASGTTGVVSNLAAIGGTTNGNPATGGTTPGPAKSCVCTIGGNSSGGSGGATSSTGAPGGPTMGANGAGGVGNVNCLPTGFGQTGGSPAAAAAAAKQTSRGTLTTTWTPAAGIAAIDGASGQGGGGGGGRDATSAGGGGGCGGCGGSGGKGGPGGGGSIALLSIDATVSLDNVTLKGGTGGAGGAGGTGGPGGSGGAGGGQGTGNGCAGGEGGMGAMGGAGSGGAGGISVAILYKGTKPSGQATLSFGTVGAPGQGGVPGVNDGPPGVAQNELEVP